MSRSTISVLRRCYAAEVDDGKKDAGSPLVLPLYSCLTPPMISHPRLSA
jgi:hypothetical protein